MFLWKGKKRKFTQWRYSNYTRFITRLQDLINNYSKIKKIRCLFFNGFICLVWNLQLSNIKLKELYKQDEIFKIWLNLRILNHETEHILGNPNYKILVKYESETNQVKDHSVKWIQNLDIEPMCFQCKFIQNIMPRENWYKIF